MSLARSASGPAGLSINTSAANTLGTTSQPAATRGLFGAGNASASPSTIGSMATTGGLFGAKPAATGGLFGTPATPTPQPSTTAGGGGLFGNTAGTQQQTTGGGLFGAKPAAAPTTATTGGGLFGNTANSANSANSATTQQSGGGLFGSTPAAATTGGGLLGQTQAKPSGGLFGSTPATAAPATTQVAAVQVNYDNLRPRSRFDDLAQPIQNEIALIDKGIQRVIKMRDEIGEFMPQHEKDIDQLGRDVQFVESKFKTVQDALNRDILTVKALQDMTKKDVADAQLSFKAADNLKLPTHYHQTGLFAGPPPPDDSNSTDASSAHASAQDLITYFNRICDDVEKYKNRLDEYRSQIERDMPGVENGLYEQIRSLRDHMSAPVQDQLSQVLSALREMGSAVIAQAGQIADTRERLSRLQAGILDSGLYSGVSS
ncbi:nucleoporin FG repeat region domain-containing protein [Trichoderma breve]|uniref:Nucleoporin FG repeat region domain-containing protein n=1 Tax=Trichoderma breve TaxID=2034170 RepID=A0A9W9E785_9HYPO|nr:nucleoporin FG repeat region domain-containing protein [Trichoderma breve]KAJ4859102.1 nucleoporin FG repeat region domain-containing protein [Trichoderma breve]